MKRAIACVFFLLFSVNPASAEYFSVKKVEKAEVRDLLGNSRCEHRILWKRFGGSTTTYINLTSLTKSRRSVQVEALVSHEQMYDLYEERQPSPEIATVPPAARFPTNELGSPRLRLDISERGAELQLYFDLLNRGPVVAQWFTLHPDNFTLQRDCGDRYSYRR